MRSLKAVVLSIIFIFPAFPALSEQFRIRKTQIITIAGDSVQETNATIGINDSLGLYFPDDMTYLEGIEIKVQIPSNLSQWRDAVAVSIYDDITPAPKASQIDYKGNRVFVTTLPTKLSWIFQIPLKKNTSIKDSIYTTKASVIPDYSKKYTFVRFQPAMKGIPEDAMYAELNVSVKPILINKGKLVVSAKSDKGPVSDFNLFIDDAQQAPQKSYMITPGLHNISIQNEDFRSEVMSVMIEQAKTTNAEFNLKSLEPTLKITAPDNAEVFLDDKPLETLNQEMKITEGDHKIRCLVGSYEIIRTITIQKGKAYTANLSIDLNFTEE